ncbi:DNA-binding CsgD family transcriptional regulator [Catenulispora sp. GAS73]|uniref:ATP-binding protein n=1 Tax=Catenulispora sp. GAS73 TaxID=3156269 RepID=UPI0035114E0F
MVNLPVSGTFIGRAGDLAKLDAAFGDPAVTAVLVAGGAGIGKSRLVGEFRVRLLESVLVLTGRCPELGGDGVAFGPFLPLARMLAREVGVAGLRELIPAANPALARWLPELAGAAVPGGESDRTRLFGEIVTVLERLSQRRPVVLVIEDLHWADDSSLDLIAFLIANLADTDVLIVATHRPLGPGRPRDMIGELSRLRSVSRIEPEPLTRYEVGRQLAALLGREPEPGFAGRVFERSGGNPLFVEALSQSTEDAPADFSGLLLICVAGLSPDARHVLDAAAVAGSPLEHELLVEAAGLPDERLDTAITQLVEAGLLVTRDTGYEFRHMLIRQAVSENQLPARRTRLHAKLAAALRANPVLLPPELRYAELSQHALHAREWPLALTASWQAAVVAGDAGAQPEQLRHLRRMLELWDKVDAPERPVDRLALLMRIAEVSAHQGAVEGGLAAVDEAQKLAGDDVRRLGKLLTLRARLNNQAGGGRSDLEQALANLPAEPPTLLRGQALIDLSIAKMFSADPSAAAVDASAAMAIAERLSGTEAASLTARAHTMLGLAAAEVDTADATGHFVAARAASPDPGTLLTVVMWESAVLLAAGAYAATIDVVQQGLRAAHETFRFVENGAVLIVKWVQALTALGRWPQALTLIEDTFVDPVPPLSRAVLLLSCAKIRLAQGDLDAAAVATDEAAPLLGNAAWAGQYRLELAAVRFDLAVARRDPGAGLRLLALLGGVDATRHHHEIWPLLTRAARQPGAVGLDALAESLPCTTGPDRAHRLTYAATVTGEAERWERAAEAWRKLCQPLEDACARFAAACAHLANGERGNAKDALQSALTTASELGATPLADEVEQTARRAGLDLGGRGSAEAAVPVADTDFGLTAREIDVLRLVAKGLSNRQIGAELFISGNTAGVHVSRILAKLGAATRTQAAAFAREHGLVP